MRFNADKYDTNLALALKSAGYEAIRRNSELSLTVVSTSGGHLDHQLVVLGLLATWVKSEEQRFALRMILRCAFSRGSIDSWQLDASATGKRFLLLPCQRSEGFPGVWHEGWNLNHESSPYLEMAESQISLKLTGAWGQDARRAVSLGAALN